MKKFSSTFIKSYVEIPPLITDFTVSVVDNGPIINIESFVAVKDVQTVDKGNRDITGYMVTETRVAPGINSDKWSDTPPSTYTITGGNGTYTLFGWVKDEGGNISSATSYEFNVSYGGYS